MSAGGKSVRLFSSKENLNLGIMEGYTIIHAMSYISMPITQMIFLRALSILPYLLPDARSKVIPEKFITFSHVSIH